MRTILLAIATLATAGCPSANTGCPDGEALVPASDDASGTRCEAVVRRTELTAVQGRLATLEATAQQLMGTVEDLQSDIAALQSEVVDIDVWNRVAPGQRAEIGLDGAGGIVNLPLQRTDCRFVQIAYDASAAGVDHTVSAAVLPWKGTPEAGDFPANGVVFHVPAEGRNAGRAWIALGADESMFAVLYSTPMPGDPGLDESTSDYFRFYQTGCIH